MNRACIVHVQTRCLTNYDYIHLLPHSPEDSTWQVLLTPSFFFFLEVAIPTNHGVLAAAHTTTAQVISKLAAI